MANTIKLQKGALVLYKRARSPMWQARKRMEDGSWHRFSTGHEDDEDAKEAALDKSKELDVKLRNNLPIQDNRKFGHAADLYVEELKTLIQSGLGKPAYRNYINTTTNWLKPFFGKKDFHQIDDGTIADYDLHRQTAMGRIPAKATVNLHNVAFNGVMKIAVRKKWISKKDMLPLSVKDRGVDSKRRGAFEDEELVKIYQHLENLLNSNEPPPEQEDKKRGYERRQVLYYYVKFVDKTGVRPGTETYGLKWKHLQFNWVHPKTKKTYTRINLSEGKRNQRYIIAESGLFDLFVDYLRRTVQAWLADKEFATAAETVAKLNNEWADRYIFAHPDGERMKAEVLNDHFMRMLRDLKLDTDAQGNMRSMYSMRHTYATRHLLRGVSEFVLADNMGTSPDMLHKHYSHLSSLKNANTLSGDDFLDELTDNEPKVKHVEVQPTPNFEDASSAEFEVVTKQ